MTRDIILRDVRDKTRLESFFRQHTALHIYSIGDLDDFFRTFTTWYALEQDHLLTAVILIYQGSSLPTVLAIGKETKPLSLLTNRIADDLPHRFSHFYVKLRRDGLFRHLNKQISYGCRGVLHG